MYALEWERIFNDPVFANQGIEGMSAWVDDVELVIKGNTETNQWSWVVRQWDDLNGYEDISSKDSLIWYDTVEEAYNELLAYLDYVAPEILGRFDHETTKSNLYRSLASLGLAAMIAFAITSPFTTPDAAYAMDSTMTLEEQYERFDSDIDFVAIDYDFTQGTVYEADSERLVQAKEIVEYGQEGETLNLLVTVDPQHSEYVWCRADDGETFTLKDRHFYEYIYNIQDAYGADAVEIAGVQVSDDSFNALSDSILAKALPGSAADEGYMFHVVTNIGMLTVMLVFSAALFKHLLTNSVGADVFRRVRRIVVNYQNYRQYVANVANTTALNPNNAQTAAQQNNQRP